MRISIAMTTYNGAKYLREQLNSFLYQTLQPDELVVCDDGSTDATLEILEDFRQQAPFAVRVYRNEANLGYIKNFEKAMALCAGDVIFLSDQDDVWFDSKIDRIAREFILNDLACVIVNDAEIVHEDLKGTGLTVAGQLLSAGLIVEQLLLGCCISFRSSFKPLIFPIPSHIHGHDGWINTLGNTMHCRYFLSDVLQLYRRHTSNTSSFPTTNTVIAKKWNLFVEKIKWINLRSGSLSASERRLEQINVLKNRINAHKDYLRKFCSQGILVEEVISTLEQELHANEFRRSLQQLPLVERFIECLRYYSAGGYRQFDGWKSLIRDIVR